MNDWSMLVLINVWKIRAWWTSCELGGILYKNRYASSMPWFMDARSLRKPLEDLGVGVVGWKGVVCSMQ